MQVTSTTLALLMLEERGESGEDVFSDSAEGGPLLVAIVVHGNVAINA